MRRKVIGCCDQRELYVSEALDGKALVWLSYGDEARTRLPAPAECKVIGISPETPVIVVDRAGLLRREVYSAQDVTVMASTVAS
jgi:hypothetical protein